MCVPMTVVTRQGAASILIIPVPVMMAVPVRQVMPVRVETVAEFPLPVMMVTNVPMTPVIRGLDVCIPRYPGVSVMKTVTVLTMMCVPVPRPVIFRLISVLRESRLTVTTGMYVPMTAVTRQGAVSMPITPDPVTMGMPARKMIPVRMEAVKLVAPAYVLTL